MVLPQQFETLWTYHVNEDDETWEDFGDKKHPREVSCRRYSEVVDDKQDAAYHGTDPNDNHQEKDLSEWREN